MALWRIVVKNCGNAACKDKRQRLEKGMFIETSTVSPIPPIGVARERPMLVQLFLNKYGIEKCSKHEQWIIPAKRTNILQKNEYSCEILRDISLK